MTQGFSGSVLEFTGHQEEEEEDNSNAEGALSALWEAAYSPFAKALQPVQPAQPGDGKANVPPAVEELKPGEKTSWQFFRDAKATYDALPEGVRKLLKDKGFYLVVVPNVTHKNGLPELAGKTPRGWPPGTTWDNADGLQTGKKILVSEYRQTATGKWEKNTRIGGVVRHETGHALDEALGDGTKKYSDSNEFLEAYEKDVARLTKEQKDQLGYFLQAAGGRQETFADVFALLSGGPCNEIRRALLTAAFPHVQALIKKKLESLK